MLEVCVDEASGIEAAVRGGAQRLELCAALSVGGLTPSESLVRLAAQAPIPTHLLARPREGDFRHDRAEAALVAADISLAAQAGLAGVVIGASEADYRLDASLLSKWIAHARREGEARGTPLSLTLHRAFDLCPDLDAALENAVELGFDRILTSGGAPKALGGAAALTRLVERAGDRIIILAGSGVDPETAPAILATGVRELHASCRSAEGRLGEREHAFGFQAGPRLRTDPAKVAVLCDIIGRNSTLNHTNM